ncbi:MAG: PEP-CTERM sorting domain-containing protein [Anaerohalosphaeraceae bacterium]
MKSMWMLLVLILLVSVQGFGMQAPTYSDSTEYRAGSGANTAYIALDFDDDSAFVFKYQWDGQATAWDALQAIDADGAFEMSYADYGWGVWVYDFGYPGGVEFDYGAAANTGWTYYTSENNVDWEFSMVGVQSRTLTDGSWDSWVWTDYPADWSMPNRQPGQAAVPEPLTLALLGLGALLMRRK